MSKEPQPKPICQTIDTEKLKKAKAAKAKILAQQQIVIK